MKKLLWLVFILLLGTMGFSQEFTRKLKVQDKRMNGPDVKLLQEKLLLHFLNRNTFDSKYHTLKYFRHLWIE